MGAFGVQTPCWFVREQQCWVVDECAGQCDPLLLAAGELTWHAAFLALQTQFGQ
jgi:hypothetical protein